MITYFLVKWPESQDFMEETWFDNEAYLANNDRTIREIGCSAYFIPTHRYLEKKSSSIIDDEILNSIKKGIPSKNLIPFTTDEN